VSLREVHHHVGGFYRGHDLGAGAEVHLDDALGGGESHQPEGPGLHLDVAGHLSVARGGATGYSGLYVAIIPAARLRYDLAARLDLYGEVGLGFFVLRTSLDNNLGSDTQVGAVLRFPIGLRYALSSGVDLVFEPAGLSIYFNSSGNKFHYSLLAGILVEI